ncbi:2Fe-2S iron-sulfur cluster binding domain-containing protein [Kangiella sp. HZ709]|uniref:2Fe-2S iron-sulfur cluster-binding protein n=1 Tax=Kangiella sp. HZ709 TaxID=2666328 RepID=UPI0012B01E22|nr:2Fe-2S iron-sulfur cluster binding domain-containing protein [Kangiella sp. HZ709]MRX28553.1 2Fe-2S iron-sulfur cluster binding domain-containing protein [Kangiella sp. HZ709]
MFGLFDKAKEHTAYINDESSPLMLKVEKGKTLLNAALSSGLPWPHRCKVGSCGSCIAQILSGKIKPQIDFTYVLNADEIANGYILACQSELCSDVRVKVNLDKSKKRSK